MSIILLYITITRALGVKLGFVNYETVFDNDLKGLVTHSKSFLRILDTFNSRNNMLGLPTRE